MRMREWAGEKRNGWGREGQHRINGEGRGGLGEGRRGEKKSGI